MVIYKRGLDPGSFRRHAMTCRSAVETAKPTACLSLFLKIGESHGLVPQSQSFWGPGVISLSRQALDSSSTAIERRMILSSYC